MPSSEGSCCTVAPLPIQPFRTMAVHTCLRGPQSTVMLVKNAHCNAGNISDIRFVYFANGFGDSILQPASTEGVVAVTVLVFSRGDFGYP